MSSIGCLARWVAGRGRCGRAGLLLGEGLLFILHNSSRYARLSGTFLLGSFNTSMLAKGDESGVWTMREDVLRNMGCGGEKSLLTSTE